MRYKLTFLSILGIVIIIVAVGSYLIGLKDVWSDFIYLAAIPLVIGIFLLDYVVQYFVYIFRKRKYKK